VPSKYSGNIDEVAFAADLESTKDICPALNVPLTSTSNESDTLWGTTTTNIVKSVAEQPGIHQKTKPVASTSCGNVSGLRNPTSFGSRNDFSSKMVTHNVKATSLSKRPVSAVSNAIFDAGSEEEEGSEYEIEEGNESEEEDHHPKSKQKSNAKSLPTNTGVAQNSLPTNICVAQSTLNKLDVPGKKIKDTIVRYNMLLLVL
jgi:hypothetical protein